MLLDYMELIAKKQQHFWNRLLVILIIVNASLNIILDKRYAENSGWVDE